MLVSLVENLESIRIVAGQIRFEAAMDRELSSIVRGDKKKTRSARGAPHPALLHKKCMAKHATITYIHHVVVMEGASFSPALTTSMVAARRSILAKGPIPRKLR